jgi:hypothetical protein
MHRIVLDAVYFIFRYKTQLGKNALDVISASVSPW